MSFLDLLFPQNKPTGYLEDSEDWLKSLPHHEIFAGGDGIEPDWESLAPAFRSQESTMMCTAFAACNALSMLNKKETGEDVVFSPLELFTRSYGSVYGNTIQNTANALGLGLVREENAPWIGPVTEWDAFIIRLMGEYAKAKAQPDGKFAIRSLTSVNTSHESIRLALKDSPVIAILNVGRGYFDDPAPYVSSGSAHAVVITKVPADGKIRVMDSLTQTKGFNGFHWLSSGFQILNAFGILDLPNDWQHLQDEAVKEGRYGKPVNLTAEYAAMKEIESARLKNPTHASYLLNNKNLYTKAIAYGGYSIQDILNAITALRRGLKAPFDFSRPRQ